MTRHAEVIGDPIAQSKSPAIHGFWIERLGLDADYRATQVDAGGLADYIADRRRASDWCGCNVTMPHKQAIMPLLDRLEPLAKQVGAVNTVVKAADGKLVGRNTDVAGFLEPLTDRLRQQHYFRMARVIGTGGAARQRFAPGDEWQATAALRLESCSAGFDCLRYRHGPRGYTIFEIRSRSRVRDHRWTGDADRAGGRSIYALLRNRAAA